MVHRSESRSNMILPVKKIVKEFYCEHLNFIYKLLTITAVHCKYIVSNKPTPPTVHRVLAMGTNECIAMELNIQVQGRLSRTVVN